MCKSAISIGVLYEQIWDCIWTGKFGNPCGRTAFWDYFERWERQNYDALIFLCGATYAASTMLFVVARGVSRGWGLGTKF
jgi:hypothetical protein